MRDRQDQRSLVLATVAARRLGISRQSLRRLIKRKEIKAIKVGHIMRVYIPQSEIDRIVSGKSLEVSRDDVEPATGQDNFSDPSEPFPIDATSARTVIAGGLPKERLEAILAGSYDGPDEYLTPEDADVLNGQERGRAREAQAGMATNPCIRFSGIPTVRVWRPGETKPPCFASLARNYSGKIYEAERPPVD